jgi:hypothetical protein
MSLRKLLTGALLVTAMTTTGTTAATASSEQSKLDKIGSAPIAVPIAEGSTFTVGWAASVPATDAERHLTTKIADSKGNIVTPPDPGTGGVSNITAGSGWYLYVYLNRGDYEFLIGLGYAGASAAICGLLAPSVLGGIACAVVATIIWGVITSPTVQSRNRAAWVGYCLEVRITYVGTLSGYKFVRRNC